MSVAESIGLVVGVDTHLDSHTAAICDARGRAGSQLQVPATAAGYEQLLDWVSAAAAGRRVTWAIEGTRHYGLGLAPYLASQGHQVAEIDATRHVAGAERARAMRSMLSVLPANCWPVPMLGRCAPMVTARRCGCSWAAPSVPLDGVRLPVTRARQGAPVDLSARRCPVVLYSPGYEDDRELGTGLVSGLASPGYIVVTIDHTNEAAEVKFPGGRVEVSRQPNTQAAIYERPRSASLTRDSCSMSLPR